MKKNLLIGLSAVAFASCTTQYQARVHDDVYYTPGDKIEVAQKNVTRAKGDNVYYGKNRTSDGRILKSYNDRLPADTSANRDSSNVNNQPYNMDDYYDYQYASRLRRFYDYPYMGGYYNDYFTNSYWYNYNPWLFGSSIYMGYNFWPSWRSGFSFGFGYPSYYMNRYYGFYDPFYDPFWSPWSYSPFGWGGYYGGYGYFGGYPYGGYYDYLTPYYNSFDRNSHYYGPRTTSSLGLAKTVSGSVRSAGGGGVGSSLQTFGQRYEATVGKSVVSSPRSASGSSSGILGAPNGRISTNQTLRQPALNTPQSVENPRTSVGQRSQQVTPANNTVRSGQPYSAPRQYTTSSNIRSDQQQNAPSSVRSGNYNRQVYQRPVYSAPQRVQQYSSPSYARPRSSQEYTTPRYREMAAPSRSYNAGNSQQTRSYSAPSTSGSSYSSPSYSAPARSSGGESRSSSSSSGSSSGSSGSSSGSSSGGGHRR